MTASFFLRHNPKIRAIKKGIIKRMGSGSYSGRLTRLWERLKVRGLFTFRSPVLGSHFTYWIVSSYGVGGHNLVPQAMLWRGAS